MNLVGFDTVSLLFALDTLAASRVTRILTRERTSGSGGGRHRYGNFDGWSATLHFPPPSLFAPSTLVLTASLPRLVYGENTRPVGTRLAAAAVADLCARFAQLALVELAPSRARVCRIDCCTTFSPHADVRAVIARLGTVDLARRDRAAMTNGVTFFSARWKETVYDKGAEVDRAVDRLVGQLIRKTAVSAATFEHLSALLRAQTRLTGGALRLECRINGSRAIAKRLGLSAASPDTVLTTANAALVVDAFLRQIRPRLAIAAAPEAAAALCRSLGPVRGQRAFALLALTGLTGSIEAAASALDMPTTAAARLASSARSAGVAAIELGARSSRLSLALPAIDVARTERFERRLQRTWRKTPQATLPNFSLSSAA